MQNIKKCFLALPLLLIGCGGSIGDFDTFRPRATVAADLSNQVFQFSWLPTGNPIDPEVGEMTLTFGPVAEDGTTTFSISESGVGTSTGTARLNSGTLQFQAASSTGSIKFESGETSTVVIDSDVDDGRIRLRTASFDRDATSDIR